MQKKEYSIEVGGKTLTAIFTDLAEQAHGSVMLRYGETIVLATACMSRDAEAHLGFFNLTVDYVEKFYAAGKILGSRFTRREGKPSNEAILSSRVIDRTIRPLFDQSMRHAVQVIVTVISVDDNDPTTLAVNAASLALLVSNIPWNGPVGAVRIGQYGTKEFTVNASSKLREEEKPYALDMMVCGKGGNINMIEAAARQVPEEELRDALEEASREIGKLEEWQKKIAAELGKEKRVIEKREISPESTALFQKEIFPKMAKAIFSGPGKEKIDELHTEWNLLVKEKFADQEDYTLEDALFDDTENEILHRAAIDEDRRADGRKMDELRSLYIQAAGLGSVVHGSGIFYRGGTHVLSVLTLGGPESRHTIEGMEVQYEKRFMHHYNFPPFSTGELGRATMTGRREIGHGALAEKALAMVLPEISEFPYTMRLVSEALASNGSTSQASICAGTIALMDGGVPIKAPVAGVAMGLMAENLKSKKSNIKSKISNFRYKILTDIQGPEDHHGDMDFKVAGTKNGVTAIQLDVKVDGVPVQVLYEAMVQSRAARGKILEEVAKVIPAPRPEIAPSAPKIIIIRIKPDQIGLVIGSGGKTVKEIKEKTGAEITLEDDGSVYLTGKDGSPEKAKQIILEMTREFVPGEELKGEVVKIADFGAFVRLNQSTDGMVHISELAPFRVERVSDIIKEGMIVPVKVISVDKERGKIGLSIKQADQNFFAPRGVNAKR